MPKAIRGKMPICTWVEIATYEQLKRLAKAENVTVASYLRGLLMACIDEEIVRLNLMERAACKD